MLQLTVGELAVPVALNPKVVEAPAASDPVYDKLAPFTAEPVVVRAPFHA